MRRLAVLLAGLLTVAAVASTGGAWAAPDDYGIESFGVSQSTDVAGSHPDFTVEFELKTEPGGELPAATRDISIDLPPGLLGNPSAVLKCSTGKFATTDVEDKTNKTGCPQDSQVGIANVKLRNNGALVSLVEPVYNLEPSGNDTVARLGFIASSYPILLNAHLRPEDEYGIEVEIEGAGSLIPLLAASNTIWGVPADESHDGQRITPYEALHNSSIPDTPTGKRPSGLAPIPFMVNSTHCGVTRPVEMTATSYALPDRPSREVAFLPPVTGCDGLEFSPKINFGLTTEEAESPSGMNVELSLPQEGLENPNVLAHAHLKRAVVSFPPGLTLNPAAASGLGACSEAQIGLISEDPVRFNAAPPACPSSSKVGEATIRTPLLPLPLEGSVYLADQDDNPFDTLLSGYLAVQSQGATIKLAGRLDIDPADGHIVATVDENPQAPFETARLHLKEGPRGGLVTPSSCGIYSIQSVFSSWAAASSPGKSEEVGADSSFPVSLGPGAGPCPGGRFNPSLEAGVTNPLAGRFSPFILRLVRDDGTERFAGLSVTLPPGLTGKLAGTPYCPERDIAQAMSRDGLGQGSIEYAGPSCPAASQVGVVEAGAGAGPAPFLLNTGRAYLAGPYKEAPLSVVIAAPAVAGPFDLGVVVVRAALWVDPDTAAITAVSDPLPMALQGIPLALRDVRVRVDRPSFTLNPTSCAAKEINAAVRSERGKAAEPTSRFQVGGCRGLGFEPRLGIRLFGKTNRGAHPKLRAVLRPRPGDSNIRKVSVALPRSAFLDQGHIRTVCTRVQFAAESCPAASIYGRAKAFSPLLDRPLAGPVYLRSSSNLLPDMVVALEGQVDINAIGRIDSIRGGIRTNFETVADAPVSKVLLTMHGGAKGLLQNSRNLCGAPARADVKFTAHNGRRAAIRPVVRNDCSPTARKQTRTNQTGKGRK